MPYDTITFQVAPTGVATIALNQPQTRNALSDELLTDLIAALESARDDEAVRCLVLTSTHDKVFSSGANLGGFAADQALVHKHFGTAKFPRVFALLGVCHWVVRWYRPDGEFSAEAIADHFAEFAIRGLAA